MRVFQKRSVAAAVMLLALVVAVVVGQVKHPAQKTPEAFSSMVDSYTYVWE